MGRPRIDKRGAIARKPLKARGLAPFGVWAESCDHRRVSTERTNGANDGRQNGRPAGVCYPTCPVAFAVLGAFWSVLRAFCATVGTGINGNGTIGATVAMVAVVAACSMQQQHTHTGTMVPHGWISHVVCCHVVPRAARAVNVSDIGGQSNVNAYKGLQDQGAQGQDASGRSSASHVGSVRCGVPHMHGATVTVKETLQVIRAMGLAATHADGEYRINIRQRDGGKEPTAYYTTDSLDAIATAKAIVQQHKVQS